MAFSRKFYIGFRGVDSKLRLKNSEMLNMLVDVATMHAETCGEIYGETDFAWLLNGYRINVIKRPKYGTEIEIITWTTAFKNITSTREFEIRDGNGNLLITALSDWIRVNTVTKKPVRILPEEAENYSPDPNHTNFGEFRMPRLPEPDEYNVENSFTADWKYMDIHGHMNNSYYLDIARHFLPKSVSDIEPELSFDIAYKHEIKENEAIKCLYAESDEYYTVVLKSADNSNVHTIIRYSK